MKISVLLPTRKRVHSVKLFMKAIADTVNDPNNIQVVFRIDTDDKASIDFFSGKDMVYGIATKYVIKPRDPWLSDCWNDVYEVCNGEIVFICADDLLVTTKGWDDMIRKKFDSIPDRIAVLHNSERHGIGMKALRTETVTHPILHRNWIETVGYVMPPKLVYGGDSWIHTIAKMIDRKFLIPEMFTEHHTFSCRRDKKTGKYNREKEPDQVWLEGIARCKRQKEGKHGPMYNSKAMTLKRTNDAKKLKKFIADYGASH